MLFSFRQNISTFCLQNSDFIGGFPIRPAWDAYVIFLKVKKKSINETEQRENALLLREKQDNF